MVRLEAEVAVLRAKLDAIQKEQEQRPREEEEHRREVWRGAMPASGGAGEEETEEEGEEKKHKASEMEREREREESARAQALQGGSSPSGSTGASARRGPVGVEGVPAAEPMCVVPKGEPVSGVLY